MFDKLAANGAEFHLMLGDLNVTLNPELDNQNYQDENQNPEARAKILELMEHRNYHDPMRETSGNKKLWTWSSNQGPQKARLDNAICNHALRRYVVKTTFLSKLSSDHRGIMVTLDFDKFISGRGIWKIPRHLLEVEDYQAKIHEGWKEIYARYFRHEDYRDFYTQCTDEERRTFKELTFEELSELPMKANHKVLLEEMLLSAKGDTISFIHERKSQAEKDVLELKDRLAALDEAEVLDEALHEDISNQLKQKIAILAKDKFFQREVDWVRCGERLSPTLVNLEKSNGNQKFIPQLYVTDPDGNQTLTQ